MTALTATYALASLLDEPPVWLPPISHCEIATTDGVWGVHAELDAATEAEAYKQARDVSEENGVELHDDGRTILVDVELTGVAFRFWWLRPVLRWHVPEQCATCLTKLGAPDVGFVRLGEGDREAPVICLSCRDRMQAAWVEQGEKDTREGESTPQPATIENYPGELAMLRGVLGVVRTIARHGDIDELRRIVAEHYADERAAYAEQGEKDTAPAATSTHPELGEFIGCARTTCRRGEWTSKAEERGWEQHDDQWLCPQCAADAADRRDSIRRAEGGDAR